MTRYKKRVLLAKGHRNNKSLEKQHKNEDQTFSNHTVKLEKNPVPGYIRASYSSNSQTNNTAKGPEWAPRTTTNKISPHNVRTGSYKKQIQGDYPAK